MKNIRRIFVFFGLVIILSVFVGCVPPGGTTEVKIFVASASNGSLAVFDRLADGAAVPLQTITGLDMPRGVFVDLTHHEIFVSAGGVAGYASAYDLAARGNDSPLRTINSSLLFPQGIVFDIPNNELFITTDDKIRVYERTANGNVPPLRTITGASLDGASGIWITLQ